MFVYYYYYYSFLLCSRRRIRRGDISMMDGRVAVRRNARAVRTAVVSVYHYGNKHTNAGAEFRDKFRNRISIIIYRRQPPPLLDKREARIYSYVHSGKHYEYDVRTSIFISFFLCKPFALRRVPIRARCHHTDRLIVPYFRFKIRFLKKKNF